MFSYFFPSKVTTPITRAEFGEHTTASQAVAFFEEEIRGKTILITGVSPNGLGAECAISLAAASPKLLILAGRSDTKTAETASAITSKFPDVEVKTLKLDLASLKSCRASAEEVLSWKDVPNIQILINNAAVMASEYYKTEDGFEGQFGTNHLGHFVFTLGILPKILAARTPTFQPRIVSVSSAAHKYGGVRFDDIGFQDGRTYEKWTSYGQSKTANMLFAISLAEKLSSKGVIAVSLHPGSIKTNLVRHLTMAEMIAQVGKVIMSDGLKFKTLQEGAATHVVAAFDPTLKDHNGEYLADCVPTKPLFEYAADKEAAAKLWKLSEEMVGQTYDI